MSDGDPTLNPAGNTLPPPTAILEPDNQHKDTVGHDDSCADNDLTCSEYLSLASDNPTLETASAATSNDQNDSDCSDFLDAREGGKEKYTGHSRRSSLSSVVDGFLDECMNKVEEHERLKGCMEKEEATEPLQNVEHEENINDDHEGLKDNMEKTEKTSAPLQKGEHEVVIHKDPEDLQNDTEKTDNPSEPLQNFENEKNIHDVHDTLKNNIENTEEQSEALQNSERVENINNGKERIKDNMEKAEEPSGALQDSEHDENINNDQEVIEESIKKVEEPSETVDNRVLEESINKDQESLKDNMEKVVEEPSETLQKGDHEETINKESLKENLEKVEEPSETQQNREHEENINSDQENLTDKMEKTEYRQSEPLQNIKHEENLNNDPPTVQEDECVNKELHQADDLKVEEATIKPEEAPTGNLPGVDTVLDDQKIETREQEETDLESKETNCSNQKDTNLEQSDLIDDKQSDKSSQFQLEMEKEGFSLGCNLSLTTVFDEKGLAISENEKICEIRDIVSKLEMPHVLEKNLNLKMDPNEMANTITNNIMAKIAAKKSQTSIIADNYLAKENLVRDEEYTELDKTVEKEEQDMETSVPEPDVLEKTVPERPSPEKEQVEHSEALATETLLEKTEMPEPVVNEDVEQKFDDFRALNEVQELCNDLVNTVAGPMTPSEMKLYKTFSDVKPKKDSEDSCGDLFSPVIQSPSSYEYEPVEETCKESLTESNEMDTFERNKSLVAGEDNVHTLLNTQSTDRTELSQRENEIPLIEAKKDKPSEENTELPVKDSIPESSPSEGQQVNAEDDVVQEPCTFSTSILDKDAAEYTPEQPQGQLDVEAEKSDTMEKASSRPKRNEGIIKMVEKTEQSASGIQSSITYKKVVRSNRIPVVKAESPTRMKPVAPKPSGCSENANRSLVQNATLLSLKERIDAVRNKRHELSPKLKQGKGEEEKAERKQNASPTRKDKENAAEDSNEETVEQFGKEENLAQLDSKAQELRNEEAECLEEDEAAEEEIENSLMSSSVKSLKTCSDGRTYKKSQPPLPPGKLSALMTRYRTQLKRYNTHLADFEAYQARIKTARENLRIIQGQMIASSGDGPEGFTVPELPPNVVCNPPVPTETLKQLESENKKLKESMHKKSEELVLQKEKLTVLKNDVKALEEKIAVYESGAEKPKIEESEKHARFHAQMSKLKQQLDDEIAERASLEKKKNTEVTTLSNKIKCEISKREQLQKSLVQKAEEIDKVLSQMKELKLEKANLQSTLDEQSFLLETFKKQTQKMAEEMAMKEEKLNTIENCLQEKRKLNNDLKDRLENSEKERAESCQRIMQLSDLLVEKGDQIEENAELLSKEHARSNKLAELIRHVCNCVGCDIDSEMLRILMSSDVDGQENIGNKIKTDVENVNNERKEDLLRKDVTISSLRAELKEKQKLIDELLEFADVKNAGVCKKADDEDRESTPFKREEASMENSLIITTSKEMQRVNTQELMELLETKRHAMQRMEKQIKDLQDLHSYCGMRRTLQESKIAELELTLAGYLD